PTLAYGVERVKGVKQAGARAGNWLTKEEAEKLVNTPVYRWRREEIPARKAIRDQAILAVMVGAGLRWSEAAGLTWEQIQQRDGRWAIIDLTGKGGRVRSVGLPPWVKVALDRWAEASGVRDGPFDDAQGRRLLDGCLSQLGVDEVTRQHFKIPVTASDGLIDLMHRAVASNWPNRLQGNLA
ncbi:MAG TPA: hypothetical protein EYP41_01510, partial [Anaerolineae bacterium]|nr:hypothetical protein [Anaerolineae bacterium]